MKRFLIKTFFTIILFASASCAQQGVITQVSTIDALMTGVYDGEMTLADLKQKGDFGLGTFNTLDGEMVLLDGQFYRATAAGAVERPDMNTKTPFAAVTFFKPDRRVSISKGLDFQKVSQQADSQIPTPNIFYAIRITGTFQMVKTRSVPAQEKPYKALSEVVKTQPVFDLKHLKFPARWNWVRESNFTLAIRILDEIEQIKIWAERCFLPAQKISYKW